MAIFFCSCRNKIENVVSTGENAFSCTIFQKTICFEEEAFKRNYAVLYLQGDVNPEIKSSTIGWVNTYTKAGNEDLDFVVETADYIKKSSRMTKK